MSAIVAPAAAASSLRALLAMTLVAAFLWHAMVVGRTVGANGTTGRDFATPYYAARVALEGGDPYARGALARRAQADRTRTSVTPLRTPPPSLALGLWGAALPLAQAWQVFVAVQEIAVVLSLAVLWRWTRALGPATAVVAAAVFAVGSAVPLALQAGRGHPLVLLLGLFVAWQVGRGRQVAALLLGVGAAVNPILAVLTVPWVVQRRTAAVGLAVVGFVLAHLAVVPLLGLEPIARYWTEVAPDLLRGDWSSAATRIDAVENHALVGALASGRRVPLELAVGQLLAASGLLVLLGWLYRRPSDDPLVGLGRLSSLLLVPLLFGAITLDQHLVLALLALAAAGGALAHGRLDGRWAVPLGLTATVLLYPTKQVGELVRAVIAPALPHVATALAESTTIALVVLLVLAARIGSETIDRAHSPSGRRNTA